MEIREGTLVPRRRRLVGGAAATLGAVAVLSIMTLAFASRALAAQAPVNLGTAASYAVLAGSTVTNTGPTTVSGDLGLSPGSAVTGFPPGLVSGGVMNVANAAAVQAQNDLTTAYNDAAGRTPATTVAGDTLGGLTLTPGVYSGGALALTGTLTLNGPGVYIFQAASTLITASSSSVKLINGASPCNVFWKVGSSATLGTTTSFQGTILALTSITATTGATVDGRLLARSGAVTLDSNKVNALECSGASTDTTPPICALTGVIAGPPKQIQVTAQDTGSGLNSITVTQSTNANTVVPPFTLGTTSPVVVTATKIDQSTGSRIALQVTDLAGNVTVCDPVLLSLKRTAGTQRPVTVKHLTRAESKIQIVNGSPGVAKLNIVVNGRVFRAVRLRDGQTKTIDVASAMHRGNNNAITLTPASQRGRSARKRGGSATVVIHN